MADTLFDIFTNTGAAPEEPPKVDLVAEPAKVDPVDGTNPVADDVAVKPVDAKLVADDVTVANGEPADAVVDDAKTVADAAMDVAKDGGDEPEKKKQKKKRAPPKPKTSSGSGKKSSSSKKQPTKTKSSKTKKESKSSSSSKKERAVASISDKPVGDGRHPPGYSMLKTESDKIDRILAGLMRKKENRRASGKPVPSVCGMFNDSLLKFFKHVRSDFDDEFEEYMA